MRILKITDSVDFDLLLEGDCYVLCTLLDGSQILVYTTLDLEKLPNGILAGTLYDLRKSRYISIPEELLAVEISRDAMEVSEVTAFVDKFI